MSLALLTEEFLLLAHDDDGTAQLDGARLDRGLGGALLLELALAQRIEVVDGRVAVRDPSPTDEPLVDTALQQISDDSKARRPAHWVEKFARGTRQQTLDRLVAAGVLRVEKDRQLWVFPRTRYPSAHGGAPLMESDARRRLWTAVAVSGEVAPRTAALCALVSATGLDKTVFRELPRAQVQARLTEISEGAWAAAAVRQAIAQVQAAIIAAAVSGAVVAATSGS
jgi:hypothetical protein